MSESPDHLPILLTVDEAAREMRLGRATIYRLLAAGSLASVTIGRARRVPRASLESFVAKMAAR